MSSVQKIELKKIVDKLVIEGCQCLDRNSLWLVTLDVLTQAVWK